MTAGSAKLGTARRGRSGFALLLAILVLLAGGVAAQAFFAMRGAGAGMLAAAQRRQVSMELVDELRQSSDDLTRLVRTYIITGDVRYKRAFQQVLAIREGRAPRPEQYGRAYWDLVLAEEMPSGAAAPAGSDWFRKPRPDGPAMALQQLMSDAGFSIPELEKLMEAERRSQALARIERGAIALLEGAGGKRDPDQARALLFSHAYHIAKRDIMIPIDECGQMVEQRTRRELDEQRARLESAQWRLAAATAALLAVAARVAVQLRLPQWPQRR